MNNDLRSMQDCELLLYGNNLPEEITVTMPVVPDKNFIEFARAAIGANIFSFKIDDLEVFHKIMEIMADYYKSKMKNKT